jgi:hypothetical protein
MHLLIKMIEELDRLIAKYSSSEWSNNDNANRLVQLFTEHRASLLTEVHEINSGIRRLNEHNFLGPEERKTEGRQPNLDYFKAVEKERAEWKRSQANTHQVSPE